METWSKVDLYFSSPEFRESLLRRVDEARRSIYLDFYIYEFDDFGITLMNHLKGACRRGVAVRLLLDGMGSFFSARTAREAFPDYGIELRVYHPVPWPISSWILRQGWNRAISLLARINRRNHKKLVIIDGQFAFLGSHNIHHPVPEWRETVVGLSGPGLRLLEKSFLATWFRSFRGQGLGWLERKSYKYEKRRDQLILFNESFLDHSRNLKRLLGRLKMAKRRIWLVTPYFVPVISVMKQILDAKKRGVDVRLILPGPTDVQVAKWASRLYVGTLLQWGVRVFEYKERILHAKQLLVDDELQVGSSNVNRRSLYHDLEVDVLVSGPEVLRRVEAQYAIDFNNSRELQCEEWGSGSFWRGLLMRLALILRYWL